MKKLLLVAIVLVFVSFEGFGQFSVYPKFGLNLNKIAEGEDEDMEGLEEAQENPFHVGLRLGVGFDYAISENFSISPELLFSQRGSRQAINLTEGGLETSLDARTVLNFIEVPILARVKFGGDDLKFYLNVGPSLGFWMSGRSKTEFSVSTGHGSFSESEEVKLVFSETTADDEVYIEDASRFEFGAQFGAGILLKAGPGNLMLDVRYHMGLTDLISDLPDNYKFQTRTLAVSLGYAIPLGN